MPAVSVASTVLNERDDIDALVESLMQQTLAPAEVIIVDGGSTDGTWERLEAARSKYPTLVPIRDESCSLQRSPGPIARGRNIAIAAASSEVVACADAGCTYLRKMVSYSVTDGVLGGRTARLWRNMARCLAEIFAVFALVYSPIPLMCVLALEIYFAFRLDWTDLRKAPLRTLPARLIYSLIVPWVVAWYQTAGSITRKNRPNRQNFS